MATASLLLTLTFLLFSLHPSTSQVIVSSSTSSSSLPDPVISTPLKPSFPSSRPRGQSDVPVRVNNRDWPTERAGGGQVGSDLGQVGEEMGTRTTDQSQPLSPSQKLNSGSTQSQSTSVEAWTGTMVTAEPSGVSSAKGPTALPPTKSSGDERLTSRGRTSDGPIIPEDLDDWPATGSGSELVPTVIVKGESLVALTTLDEMPQFRSQAQTEFSRGLVSKMAEAQTTPMVSLTVQPRLSGLTIANRILSTQSPDRVTAVPVVTQSTFIGGVVTGNISDNATTPTDRPIAGQTPTVTSPLPRPITPASTNQQPNSVTPQGTTTLGVTSTTTTNKTATKAEPRSTSSSTTNHPKKATEPERTTTSTTKQSTKTGRERRLWDVVVSWVENNGSCDCA